MINPKHLIRLLYIQLLVIADTRIDLSFKIISAGKLLMVFAPLAFILKTVKLWFISNEAFVSGFLVIVALNAVFGIWRHLKMNKFSWIKFFWGTTMMLIAVIGVYAVLSIVAGIVGDNYIGNGFEVSLQTMTLMYPGAKIIKSIHIIYDGKYPPEWLMKKVYNYQKNGDLSDFFKQKNNENEN